MAIQNNCQPNDIGQPIGGTKQREAMGTGEDTEELNSFLSALSAKVHQARSFLIETDKTSFLVLKDVLTLNCNREDEGCA